jgi:hypothetical protein
MDGILCILLFVLILPHLCWSSLSSLGYFPRMLLLLPHVILISVLLATHGTNQQRTSDTSNSAKAANATAAQQPKEGTVDWYANLQAIQNLMGAV